MTSIPDDRVRIIKHEVVPDCGSYEVSVEGQPSRYFYFEDLPSRRLRLVQMTREQALKAARAYAARCGTKTTPDKPPVHP